MKIKKLKHIIKELTKKIIDLKERHDNDGENVFTAVRELCNARDMVMELRLYRKEKKRKKIDKRHKPVLKNFWEETKNV